MNFFLIKCHEYTDKLRTTFTRQKAHSYIVVGQWQMSISLPLVKVTDLYSSSSKDSDNMLAGMAYILFGI